MKNSVKAIISAAVAIAGWLLVRLLGEDDFSFFLKNATDEELSSERERIRLDYCNPNLDVEYRSKCFNMLTGFDNEISKRAWGDETPRGPSIHREHGWYISKDD